VRVADGDHLMRAVASVQRECGLQRSTGRYCAARDVVQVENVERGFEVAQQPLPTLVGGRQRGHQPEQHLHIEQ
jgi:hypothetical protein